VAKSEQAPALGAAIYAATAAGIYPSITAAITAMGNGFDKVYNPDIQYIEIYQSKYEKYLSLGDFIESKTA